MSTLLRVGLILLSLLSPGLAFSQTGELAKAVKER